MEPTKRARTVHKELNSPQWTPPRSGTPAVFVLRNVRLYVDPDDRRFERSRADVLDTRSHTTKYDSRERCFVCGGMHLGKQ